MDDRLAEALRAAAGAETLLIASDYDGTLAPIVANPDEAVPHEEALDALVRLAAMPGVAGLIVSGRSLAALRQLTGAPDGVTLIGTHGIERDSGVDPGLEVAVDGLVRALTEVADRYAGTVVEAKPVGAAFHYRNAHDPEPAAEAARGVARRLGGRILDGKMVVEVLLAEGTKGTAVDAMRHDLGADAVVFLGDDVTDEDVFDVLGTDDVGVKVGPGDTLAVHRVDDVGGVAAALQLLLELRS